MSSLTRTYLEYINPDLVKAIHHFSEAWDKDQDTQKAYREICRLVTIDYNLIKRSLGYPAENIVFTFFRMKLFREIGKHYFILSMFCIVSLYLSSAMPDTIMSYVFLSFAGIPSIIIFITVAINAFEYAKEKIH